MKTIEQLERENEDLKTMLDAANLAGSKLVSIIIDGGDRLDKLRAEFLKAKVELQKEMEHPFGNN